MKDFIWVTLFFVLFAAVVGGALFLALAGVKAMHLSEDYERNAMLFAGIAALVCAGFLMKKLHAMIERRI